MNKTCFWMLVSAIQSAGFSALAAGSYERGIALVTEIDAQETAEAACDLRKSFPVAKLKDEQALRGLNYSARGWRLDVSTDDPSRTAEITAEPGMLEGSTFRRIAGEDLVVLPATGGEGTVDWNPTGIEKCVYRLSHVATVNGTGDGDSICHGYLDFTCCVTEKASQREIEVAVLDGFSHKITVVPDVNLPWQPINGAAGAGVVTDAGLADGTSTAMTFNFTGRGLLHYEYVFGDGTLVVLADGVTVEELAVSGEWRMHTVRFEDYGSHVAAFVYSAANGGQAALRGVRWEEDGSAWALREGSETRVDLREGVRTPKHSDEVLPFVYSSTNWIGDVAGATAESKSKVTIVRMTGTDPDVTSWTNEVSGTDAELVNKSGEGEKKWHPKKGVWKATFDILNGDTSIHREESWFDLRKTSTPGFMLMVF